MNFTADYANDLLRKLEIAYRSEGKSIEKIYTDLQFAQYCQHELDSKRLEVKRINENASRYQVQFTNRLNEIENMRRCRGSMDEKVYIRLMDSAMRRRRKIQQRYARTKVPLTNIYARIRELEVLRHAQKSGLRRFWDHPKYKIEKLSEDDFYQLTGLVDAFFIPLTSKKAA